MPAEVAPRTIEFVSVDCIPSADSTVSAPGGAGGRSRPNYSRRRAWALLAVHLAILAHVAHWKWGGATLSPVEPSEATDLAEHGRLNAGAIFFMVAIASTLVFGRWFCGWACHLVALQDGCRWLLMRVGLRPRAIQLGVLGLVPLVACIYMFLGPWLYRLWRGIVVETRVELFTAEFWATFPGVTMSVVTVAVCGGAAVYFLGSKGFCTYACPYGAIFGIADQLAPQRIRVTDACQGCGKCTVACSSNVRVHQEVRDFRAVVDPGCMKCLDCVAACPTDALYVGFGAPALWTSARTQARSSAAPIWPRVALSAVFVAGLFIVLLSHQRLFSFAEHGGFVAALTLGTVAVAWGFRGRSTRTGGPSLGDEALLASAFLFALFALRGYRPLEALTPWIVARAPWAASLGLDEGVPLLLSLGLAGLWAYSLLLAVRLVRRSDVSLQSLSLRASGRTTGAGWGFVGAFVVALGLTVHAATVRGRVGREADAQAAALREAELEFARGVALFDADQRDAAERSFQAVLARVPSHVGARKRLVAVYFAGGRDAECAREIGRALDTSPGDPDLWFVRGLLAIRSGDEDGAQGAWLRALDFDAGHPAVREALAALCEERGDALGARTHRAAARSSTP